MTDSAGPTIAETDKPMKNSDVAFLLPGQGAFYPGVLRHLSEHYPEVRDILQEMDEPVRAMLGCSVTAALLEEEPRSIEHWLPNQSDLLQIALSATCVVVHHLLRDAGITPSVLVGHSLGEIAALAAGGAITPAQASEVVCARTIALRQAEVAPGYMLSLATSASRTQALLDAVADPRVAVAVTNHPDQTVVSGHQDAMDRVAAAARELRMGGHRLNSPYPFHSPLLADAARAFHNSIKHIGTAPLKTTVYSPILGRTYEPADDLMAELASHLTRPVRFSDAMVAVADSGIRTYVECGAMPTLVKLIDRALAARAADARFVAPLPGSGDEWAAWNDALARLRGTKLTVAQPSGLARALVPEVSDAEFAAFWSAHGDQIRRTIEAEYARFTEAQSAAAALGAKPSAGSGDAAIVRPRTLDPDEVLTALIGMYAEALEYPVEVFTAQTPLEGELGVDSVKQTELLARVSDLYALPLQDTTFRLSDYPTLGHVRDLVMANASDGAVMMEAA